MAHILLLIEGESTKERGKTDTNTH